MTHTLSELVMGTTPIVVPETRGFWEATLAGELRVQVCGACGNKQYPGAACCERCLSQDLTWEPTSGRGEVYSFTVVRRAIHPSFAQQVPYVVADVRLDEGPIITSNITDISPEDVRIGMRVAVWFDEPVEDAFHERLALPKFRPET